MIKLIENGDVILDGTGTRAEKERVAFETLERIQDILIKYNVDSLEQLDAYLYYVDFIRKEEVKQHGN